MKKNKENVYKYLWFECKTFLQLTVSVSACEAICTRIVFIFFQTISEL